MYFFFSYFYLSMARNINVYTPNQGTNREKYFNHISFQRINADSGGKSTPFRPFLPSRTESFPSFDGKGTGPVPGNWTSKWLFPRRHNKEKHKEKMKEISIQGKSTILKWKNNLKYGKIRFIMLKRFMFTFCIY